MATLETNFHSRVSIGSAGAAVNYNAQRCLQCT